MTELAADQMTGHTSDETSETLLLDSDLASMSRLPEWVDAVALRHHLPEATRFAAQLCLEESVSNSIRHGYRGIQGSRVRVSFLGLNPQGWTFAVEDDASPFNPLEQQALPPISPDSLAVGGQGIRLLRAFATTLDYQQTATGNRLHISFSPPTASAEVATPA